MPFVSVNLGYMTKSLCEIGYEYCRLRRTYYIFSGSLVVECICNTANILKLVCSDLQMFVCTLKIRLLNLN